MEPTSSCPDADALRRLLLGQVPEPEAGPLEEHLARCERCLALLPRLEAPDALVERLRGGAAVAADLPHGEAVEALMRRLRGLQAVTADPAVDPVREGPGTVLGAYKLLELIGEGGFGLVFMAEQQRPIRRKVAVKVLKPGMDTRQVIARFEAERQVLALMDHPHIAKVLDAGDTPSGRPYFVMDLVRGVPITEYCDRNSLTPRERLEMFVTVCQAVQHAHQKGIIHRDLKPSNVLVTLHDGTPVVKVIDFGIAKALGQQLTDKTLFTGFAQMVGTPLYMSPEQAEMSGLDVDTRSDIYSLGVLLYELLTGTTPFDRERFKGAGYDEIRRVIREEEPPKPSTRISTLGQAATTVSAQRRSDPRRLSRLFRGELDWVVMKALAKDRNRRYDTAGALAADVLRYLHGEPVTACPPSAWYRLRTFARRNRARLTLAAGAGLALALVLAALAGSVGWVARDRAARREEGERRAEAALQEVGRFLEQEKWPEALGLVGQAEAVLRSSGGGEDLVGRASRLRRHLEMAQSLEEARLRQTVTRGGDWDKQAGEAAYAEAFAKYGLDVDGLDLQEAAGRIRASPISRQLVAALDDWAYKRKRLPAEGWQRRLALARAADPDRWRNRLRDALEGKDDRALEEVIQSASPDDWPPATLVLLGHLAHGPALAGRSADLLRRAQRQHPDDFRINVRLALTLKDVQPPPLEEVVHYCDIAVALRPQSAGAHFQLGLALSDLDRPGEAVAEFRKVVDLDPDYADAHNNLGWNLARQGKLDEAVPEYHKAIALNPTGGQAHVNLRQALASRGRLHEVIPFYTRELERAPKTAALWRARGDCYLELGDYAGALPDFARAAELEPGSAAAWNRAAWLLATCPDVRLRDPGRAVEMARKAVDLAPADGACRLALAWACYRSGDWGAALEAAERAMPLHKGGDSADWFLLAMIHWRLGDRDRARQWYDRADRWMADHHQEDWPRFRAEAATLLGLPLFESRVIPYQVSVSPFTINVLGVAFTPDSRRVLAGGDDNGLRLYEVETGKEVRRFTGHTHWVYVVALSSDGRRALSGGADRTLRWWDVETGKEVRVTPHAVAVRVAAFSPDGRRALSVESARGRLGHVIRLWDVETGEEVRQLAGHTGTIQDAVFSPDGRHVLSAGADRTLRLWDVETGEEVRQFRDPGTTTCVCFAPDGRTVLSARSDDPAPHLWDVATGQLLRRLEGSRDNKEPPGQVVFTPDGLRAVSVHHVEGKLRLWDVGTGEEVGSLQLERPLRVNRVAVSADGRWVASAAWRGVVSLGQLAAPPPSP
jgi:serine/threonine protein kinase/tetratricopeptide (TPR) repeat protein